MKALVLHGIHDLRVEERPKPTPGRGQVLVRVRAVGVCGSDVHYYTHGRIGDQVLREPMIVGHEAAGEVAALGPGADGLAVGDRVAVEPALSCGACEWCTTGRPNLCPNVRFFSTPPHDGMMCELAVAERHQCAPLPEGVSFEEAAMLEPLQVAVHATNLIGTFPGETVVVVGCGCIGLGCMALARVGGAGHLIVTDRLDYRLALARKLGADATVNVEKEDPGEAIRRLTDGRGADLVLECTNRAAGPPQALEAAAIGGRVAFVGIPQEDEVTINPHPARRKELRVQFVRRSRFALRQALNLVASKRVDVAAWVTHRFALAEAKKAFDLVEHYADGVLKAVILP